jgi:hypothetical protein
VFLNATIRKHVCPLSCVFEAKEFKFYESLHEMAKLNVMPVHSVCHLQNYSTELNHERLDVFAAVWLTAPPPPRGSVRINLTEVVVVRQI